MLRKGGESLPADEREEMTCIAEDWNGLTYGKCWKRASYCTRREDTIPAEGWENKNIELRPILKETGEDEWELVGYEEV